MRFFTHISASVPIAIIMARALPTEISVPVIFGVVVGSISPDVDFPHGNTVASWGRKIARRAKRRSVIGLVFVAPALYVLGTLIIVWGWTLKAIVKILDLPHRGALHSPLLAILFILAGGVLSLLHPLFSVLVGIGIGWITHLLLDMMTPSGIAVGKWRISGPVVTGSLVDYAIGIVMLVFAAIGFVI